MSCYLPISLLLWSNWTIDPERIIMLSFYSMLVVRTMYLEKYSYVLEMWQINWIPYRRRGRTNILLVGPWHVDAFLKLGRQMIATCMILCCAAKKRMFLRESIGDEVFKTLKIQKALKISFVEKNRRKFPDYFNRNYDISNIEHDWPSHEQRSSEFSRPGDNGSFCGSRGDPPGHFKEMLPGEVGLGWLVDPANAPDILYLWWYRDVG